MTVLSLLIASVIAIAVYLDCRRDAREVERERFFAKRCVWKRALQDGNWRVR